MKSATRRLEALEAAHCDRLLALPHRKIFERGLLRLERLPDAERIEIETIIETALNEEGYLDHLRLTQEQRKRGRALLDSLKEMIV